MSEFDFYALEPRIPMFVSGFGPQAMALAGEIGDGLASPRQSPRQGQRLPGRQAFRAKDKGHAIRLVMDGQPLETPYTGGEIFITNLERGTHTLQVDSV